MGKKQEKNQAGGSASGTACGRVRVSEKLLEEVRLQPSAQQPASSATGERFERPLVRPRAARTG